MGSTIIKLTLFFVLLLNVACNNSTSTVISQEELLTRLSNNDAPTIVDVRSTEEFTNGHLPGAVNIPIDKVDEKIKQLNLKFSDEVVLYCETGRRAKKAEKILVSQGYFEIRHLEGGMSQWRENKLQCEGC